MHRHLGQKGPTVNPLLGGGARLATVWFMLALAPAPAKADTIKTGDGQIYQGKAQIDDGMLTIVSSNGSSDSVVVSNLEAAIFADLSDVIPGEHSLVKPWAGQDVGNVGVPGGAKQTGGSFIVRASGIGVGQSIDAFHFVFEPKAGDAEILPLMDDLMSKIG